MIATMRSVPKGKAATPESILAQPATTPFLSADPMWASSSGRTPQQASQAWTEREIESRHHFIIVRRRECGVLRSPRR